MNPRADDYNSGDESHDSEEENLDHLDHLDHLDLKNHFHNLKEKYQKEEEEDDEDDYDDYADYAAEDYDYNHDHEEDEDSNDENTLISSKELEFYLTCKEGTLEEVKRVLRNKKKFDVNWADSTGWTSFFIACSLGRTEIVKYLLTIPRIDVNRPNSADWTPLFIACYNSREEVIKLLLDDHRVDVNLESCSGQTPLWIACWKGREITVKILLASMRNIETRKRTNNFSSNPNTTPEEIARRRWPDLANLIRHYEMDPKGTTEQLRRELNWVSVEGLIFGTIVFLCDGLLKLKEKQKMTERERRAKRFFIIAARLNLDLQMVLANRCNKQAKNLIPKLDREVSFSSLAMVWSKISNRRGF